MKNNLFLFITLILLVPLVPVTAEPKKTIVATVEEFPNYIFHMYSIARIGYDNDYSRTYENSVGPADLECLKRNARLLAFGNGQTGPLTVAFLFLPGYLGFRSADEVREYYSLLRNAVLDGKTSEFIGRYRDALARIRLLYPFDTEHYLKSVTGFGQNVDELCRVFSGNYAGYDAAVWPAERSAMEAVAVKISEALRDRNYISRWEELTGEKFLTDRYEILLCSSIDGGARANSLGYERNVFNSHEEPGSMVSFISHETGTHLLINVFYGIIALNRYDYPTVYAAYESLAEFYNRTFVSKEVYRQSDDHERFISIYDEILKAEPGIKPADLLLWGIETFIRK